MDDIIKEIERLVEEGKGRPAIMKALPDATEWQVRSTIKKMKRSILSGTDREKKEGISKKVTGAEVVSDLRPVVVTVPKLDLPKPKTSRLTTAIVVGDTHGQFLDETAFNVALQIIRDVQPDILVHIGDLGDFYSVSKYDKDPNRRIFLQDDLEASAKILGMLTQVVGQETRKILTGGNHDARLQNYINKNAPALANLDILKIENLLGLKDLGWEYTSHDMELFPEFIITHGTTARSHSGSSAASEMSRYWTSGISGHCHRLAIYYYTSRRDFMKGRPPTIWVENGHLAKMEMEYFAGNKNWQQGFTVLQFTEEGYPIPQLVHISNGRAVFGGKLYIG